MSVRDRYVPIGLAVVAFSVTVAVLWHRQTESPSQPSASHAVRKQPLEGVSAFQPVNAPDTAPQQQPFASLRGLTPVRGAAPENEAPADTASTADEIDAELPVALSFRHAPGGNGLEAGLANMAGRALEITATLLKADTQEQQQLQFTVGRGTGHRMGAADGWELHSGDQITVQSPPFHDRVFPVP